MPMQAAPASSADGGADARTTMPAPGVLVVNLGTPRAPTAAAVRRYLAEFLSDRRVVQVPRLLWWPLLHGLILPLRSPRVAHKYAQVWMDGGSPLAVYTTRLAAAIGERLPGVPVAHAMRYGGPAIDAAVRDLRARGCTRVLVLPLYPQYSTTTTASVADVLERAAKEPAAPKLRMVDEYHLDPGVIAALADSVRAHWSANGRGERLLMSFHGIPQRLVDGGDPYSTQCHATAAALAGALGLGHGEWLITFQSRFGREQWLQPATDATLRLLGDSGVGRVDVVCPGFPADCLETLEEIALQNAALFRAAGGGVLSYIPALNDSPAHADALAALLRRGLDAWR